LLSLWLLLIGAGALLLLALRQAPHLYDIAAQNAAAAQSFREAKRRGDQTLIAVRKAQQGKMSARRLGFVSQMSPSGPWAIVWREALIAARANSFIFIFFLATTLLLNGVAVFDADKSITFVVLLSQLFLQLSVAMVFGQSGFFETLRRVDIQKPLPFSPYSLCLMEVLGKSVLPAIIALVGGISFVLVQPEQWPTALTMAISFPSVALVVVAVQFIVILAFPGMDDATQAAFRGLMQFLGSALAAAPAAIVAIAIANSGYLLLGAVCGIATNVAVMLAVVYFAAPMYASFNPSE
jgi:hypothetical protein